MDDAQKHGITSKAGMPSSADTSGDAKPSKIAPRNKDVVTTLNSNPTDIVDGSISSATAAGSLRGGALEATPVVRFASSIAGSPIAATSLFDASKGSTGSSEIETKPPSPGSENSNLAEQTLSELKGEEEMPSVSTLPQQSSASPPVSYDSDTGVSASLGEISAPLGTTGEFSEGTSHAMNLKEPRQGSSNGSSKKFDHGVTREARAIALKAVAKAIEASDHPLSSQEKANAVKTEFVRNHPDHPYWRLKGRKVCDPKWINEVVRALSHVRKTGGTLTSIMFAKEMGRYLEIIKHNDATFKQLQSFRMDQRSPSDNFSSDLPLKRPPDGVLPERKRLRVSPAASEPQFYYADSNAVLALSNRVSACEAALESLISRLASLESHVRASAAPETDIDRRKALAEARRQQVAILKEYITTCQATGGSFDPSAHQHLRDAILLWHEAQTALAEALNGGSSQKPGLPPRVPSLHRDQHMVFQGNSLPHAQLPGAFHVSMVPQSFVADRVMDHGMLQPEQNNLGSPAFAQHPEPSLQTAPVEEPPSLPELTYSVYPAIHRDIVHTTQSMPQ